MKKKARKCFRGQNQFASIIGAYNDFIFFTQVTSLSMSADCAVAAASAQFKASSVMETSDQTDVPTSVLNTAGVADLSAESIADEGATSDLDNNASVLHTAPVKDVCAAVEEVSLSINLHLNKAISGYYSTWLGYK